MEADQWKVIAWFPQLKVRLLTPAELETLDPDSLAFWNVNTPDEFVEAERIYLSHEGSGSG
jgi:molybdopterin-guanine dinucleotide biosynthesis protein A